MRFKDSTYRSAESPATGGVVSDIEDPFCVLLLDAVESGDSFQAPRPAGAANSILDCGGCNGETVVFAKLDCGGNGERNIPLLVRSCKWRVDFDRGAQGDHSIGIARANTRHVGSCANPVHIKLRRHLAKNLVGFRVLRQRNHRSAGAQDSRFFSRDGGDGRAQPFHVVERNIGDNREQRINDVGGIEATAHTHLEHSHIDMVLGEVEKCECGEDLKVAGQLRQAAGKEQLLACIVDAEIEARKIVVGDFRGISGRPSRMRSLGRSRCGDV